MRAYAAIFCLLAASPLAAQEPTLEQLMERPSAKAIAARWKAVCLENAGDVKAQQAAVKKLGISWPYQAMFEKKKGLPHSCIVVSSIEEEATMEGVANIIAEAVAPVTLTDPKIEGLAFRATAALNGSPYQISAGLRPSQGNKIATFALEALGRGTK